MKKPDFRLRTELPDALNLARLFGYMRKLTGYRRGGLETRHLRRTRLRARLAQSH